MVGSWQRRGLASHTLHAPNFLQKNTMSPETINPALPCASKPAFSPEEIGQRAQKVASDRFITSHRTTTDRLHRFETLTALLQHIKNIPAHARPDLRIKGNDLVAKLGKGDYQTLIAGFQLPPDRRGSVNALEALGIRRQVHGSLLEALRCMMSRIVNRDASKARTEHLPLDRRALERAIDVQRSWAMIRSRQGSQRGHHGDIEFLSGKDKMFLEGLSLTGMPLHECNLQHADLRGMDLSGCSLPLNLSGVDLREAKLSNVAFGRESSFHRFLSEYGNHSTRFDQGFSLKQMHDDYTKCNNQVPDFTRVVLTGAKISMRHLTEGLKSLSSKERTDYLDRRFNQINNPANGSVLSSIHSIGEATLKRSIMEETLDDLMTYTRREDRVALAEPLADVLFNHAYIDSHPDRQTQKTYAILSTNWLMTV